MSHYRKIDVRIWNDAKFCQLSDNGKLLFLFVLTHPYLTSLGAMRATLAGLSDELGWKQEDFTEAFTEASARGLIKYEGGSCFIWLPNFLKYNGPESPNVVKSWVKALDMLPECALKDELIMAANGFVQGLSIAFAEALPEAFQKGMANQEQEQEQEQEQDEILNRKHSIRSGEFAVFCIDRFTPSEDDLSYCKSLALSESLDHITAHFRLHHTERGTKKNQAGWSKWYRGWVDKKQLPNGHNL